MQMNSLFRALPVLLLCLSLVQCDKTPEQVENLPYPETRLDENAGTWKAYILQNPTEVAVAVPADPTSAEYLAELDAVVALQQNLSGAQQDAIQFWGENGVLRWHEIARELAAQYNAPPKNNADGTYPNPDPNNPTSFPRFPFANPPYASRAFALLAVAQYDALVATWHYKFTHNRKAPYQYNNQRINPMLPQSDLPSYPSEDAVVAAASRELLKFLFPGEKEYLDGRATEHKNSRLWAGSNVQSDLDAGEALGVAIAQKIIAYAKTDGMGQANAQANYPNLKADAAARGFTTQWTSRELPARPPMLPFFGNVKMWNMTAADKVAVRPDAPPLPGSAAFETDHKEMLDLAKNRSREEFRIAAFWADGPGTYTPPGHWNRKGEELIRRARWNEIRTARAMALLNTAMEDAGISCWDTKYYYLTQRPSEVDSDITTSTGIPNFPGYTSGHSTFSAAGAEVLSYLFPEESSTLKAWAKEASDSRVYGCIHFRIDCSKGLEAGEKIGAFAVARGRQDGSE